MHRIASRFTLRTVLLTFEPWNFPPRFVAALPCSLGGVVMAQKDNYWPCGVYEHICAQSYSAVASLNSSTQGRQKASGSAKKTLIALHLGPGLGLGPLRSRRRRVMPWTVGKGLKLVAFAGIFHCQECRPMLA